MKKLQLYLSYQKYILAFWNKWLISFLTSNVYLLVGMVTPLVTKALLDYAYPNRDIYLLTLLIIVQVAIFFIRQYFGSISGYLDMYVDNDLTLRLKSSFYTHLQNLSLKFHSEKKTGDLIFRMNRDISEVVNMITQAIAVILQTLIRLVILLFICLRFDWRLTLLALSGIPLYFIETHFFARKQRDILKKELEIEGGVQSYLQERLPAIKMVKSFGKEKTESTLFRMKIQELFLAIRQSYIVSFLNRFTDSTINSIWLAILGWYAGYHVITGVLSIGELLAITAYVTQIYGPVMEIGDIYKFMIEGMVSLERVDEVISRRDIIEDSPDALEIKDIKGNISFRNVTFGYSLNEPVLESVNIDIKAGTSVALVGPSGTGKTTFTDLIIRLYDIDKGEILIDGIDIRKIKQSSLKKEMAVVNQEITIFRETIEESIKYGNEEADFKDVVRAAQLAGANEFIEKLPQGYNAMLEERGLNLSGGQRQRIVIARALIRDPRILILDEATSAIDPESEAYIHSAMMQFKQGRTVIAIAHKLSTIIDSDEILFLEKGRIAERGNFNELMERKGRFYEFFEMEFSNFRYFSERLAQEIARVKRYKRPFSLIMMELRDLGRIVSEIGEEKLNTALLETEEIIRRNIRDVDFSTKYYKDRFLIGLPETDFEHACLAAERIEKVISDHIYLKGDKDIKFVPALGVSSAGEETHIITELYRNAEKMLEDKLGA